MAFEVKGFGSPDYGVSTVAGNPAKLDSGMTKLNEILDYQGKSLSLQKQQALQQAQIEAGKAEAQKSITGAEKSQLELATEKMNKIRQAQVASITDPIVTRAATDPEFAKNPETVKHLKSLIDQQAQTAVDSGLDPNTVKQQVAPYHQLAETNPAQFQQFLKSRLIAGLDTQAQAGLNQLSSAGGQPAIYNPVQGTLSAAGFPGQAPQAGAQAISQGVTSAQMESPEYSQPVKPSYEVRKAGQPYAPAPTEVADRDAGNAYKNNLIGRQTQLTTDRRNVDEVIHAAREIEKNASLPETGPMGVIKRKFADIIGDPTYRQLSKDLANTQLSNMKTLGTVNTNEGLELQKAANGDVTYPPEVLINIANRAKADMTNIDMQALAAKKYSDQFGDQNMNSFKQMWSKNADSKIFEVINLAKEPNLSKEEKEKIVNKLMGTSGSKVREEYNQKYLNILKLQQNGTL